MLIPIQGGVRLTGKAKGFNVGLRNMQTESLGATTGNNFTAARLARDLPNRSGVGAIFVNRTGTGALAGDQNYNRTFGVDGKLGIREAGTIRPVAARTQPPGPTGHDYPHRTSVAFPRAT